MDYPSKAMPGQRDMFGTKATPGTAPPELTPAIMRAALARLRRQVSAKLDDGVACPCCDKYARRYRRKFNASMARSLIWLVRQSEASQDGWVDVPATAPRWLVRTNQLPTVRWWGMIERAEPTDDNTKHSGRWRPTDLGKRFAYQRTTAQAAAVTYNGEVIGFEGGQITIDGALGAQFSYFDLMGWDK